MLHEVLLALQGFPGPLFVKGEDGNYTVVKDVPFLHPSEIAILDERLCQLINCHLFVLNFIKEHGHWTSLSDTITILDSDDDVWKPEGLYVRSLCRGLEKISDAYQALLVKLEEDVLKDPHLPLTYICVSLEEYTLSFPPLVSLLKDVKQRRIRGCNLLDLIHSNVMSSNPCFHRETKKLMRYCHGVMYRQTSAWLLYGMLRDPYKEFFIQQLENARKLEENETVEEGNGDSSHPLQIFNGHFFLQPDMLPTYIPVSLAEKICFVGESVKLLESKEHKCGDGLDSKRFIALSNKHEFAHRFISLENEEEFHLHNFEAIIEELRTSIAEQLWKLVMEGVGLKWHLKIVKDFFLLARGELYQVFIDHAGEVLQLPVMITTERNVNASFQAAARTVFLEDDHILDKFRITIKNTSKKNQTDLVEFHTKCGFEIGWNSISLTYNVSWPLHIIFTKNVLEKYNVVFRFLLFVKRVQLEMQHCWTLQMQWKSRQMEVGYFPAWRLRTLMAFVLNNIQYYLQVDVLESLYSLLIDKLEKTHDFEAIQLAHEQFVINLLAQTFLSSKAIATCITELLDLCLSFCQQYTIATSSPPRLHDQGVFPSATFASNVSDMQKQFSHKASFFFQVLSSTQTYQATPFVEQLVMRLDYNKYFSNDQLMA